MLPPTGGGIKLSASVSPCDWAPMSRESEIQASSLPGVDRVLRWPRVAAIIERHGRDIVLEAVREALGESRERLTSGGGGIETPGEQDLGDAVEARVEALLAPSLRRVFNLTGTVLHTNLGRAVLPPEAIAAMAEAARGPVNLEYDLQSGRRGDRASHVAKWITRLCGAEAALVVNNNAAAVLLVLNTLALRKEVAVSRGELIEIGGSFRLPDIMARAGSKLVEVGTTNRTHARDYSDAINARTALLMKVHTSNYVVEGFSAAVEESVLARMAAAHGLALLVDLGSGTLVDLERYGLPPEPTVGAVIGAGADVVTFSGDKLLGGPQAGIIAGRADLVARIKRNPMTRALRVDKMTLAALGAVLRLYADPARLAARLPALAAMTRTAEDIRRAAERMAPVMQAYLGEGWRVAIAECMSQVGSGALPVGRLPSMALKLVPAVPKRSSGRALRALAGVLRALPVPVIGRVHDGALWLDLRCLDDETGFTSQLGADAVP